MLSWAAGLRNDWSSSTTLCTRIALKFHSVALLNEEWKGLKQMRSLTALSSLGLWDSRPVFLCCFSFSTLQTIQFMSLSFFYWLVGFVLLNAAVDHSVYHFYDEDWENSERLGLSKSLKPLLWESPADPPSPDWSKDLSCDSLWQDFIGTLKALLHQSLSLTSQMMW